MKKGKKRILGVILLVLFIMLSYWYYMTYMSVTKVALINYPNYLYAKVAKSNNNKFISVESLEPDSLPNLGSYDMFLIFGMGIKMPESEVNKLKKAAEKGAKIFLQSSTNPNLELTNIFGKQFDVVSDYLDNAGTKNYCSLLNYIRNEIDNKTWFNDSVAPVKLLPSSGLFYHEGDGTFEEVDEFEKFALKKGIHKKEAPKVALITSVPGPFMANRDHIDALMDELHSRGLNVYPITGFEGRLNYMKKIQPNLIVYMPHGRLSMGGGSAKKIITYLEKLNVPLLCPVSVFQPYNQWLKDKQGLVGGLLSQSVTMPEFDGGIVPYAPIAQYKDEKGFMLFKAVPNRMKKFGDIAEKYLSLTTKSNKDKKVAFVYFKGPGKNALVASNMEVLPSLHNTLLNMQKNGYNLGKLPKDFETFKNIVNKQGPVLGPYAEGAFDNFLKTGSPELIPVADYEKWCKESLPEDMYQEVVEKYGKAPGSYMNVTKNDTDFIAAAVVKFGNVVLMPQPLPGVGTNEFALIHGAKVAPPHAYIAPYMWIQNGFKADAVIHFGTHGSLEFTPGKQIALSDYDWTDPLIGTSPHLYVYTISNVGEGMIAKRRSYAVLQSYLTPPFIEAQGFNKRKSLIDKIHKYENAKGALRNTYALEVKKIVVENKINKDLDLDSVITKPYSSEDMMRLANYLEEVEHEKITGGLYTMGISYSNAKVDETLVLMYSDALGYDLAEIDILRGKLKRKQLENKIFLNEKYVNPSKKYISQVIKNKNVNSIFKTIVRNSDIERAKAWKKIKAEETLKFKMKMQEQDSEVKNDSVVTDAERKQLRDLIIKISPDSVKRDFILKLESKKQYDRAISFLDPAMRAKVAKIAKFIPAMGKAIALLSQKDMHQIIVLIQKPELYKLAMKYINDKGLEAEVAKEKERRNIALMNKALTDDYYKYIDVDINNLLKEKRSVLLDAQKKFDFFNKNIESIQSALKNNKTEKNNDLSEFLAKKAFSYKENIDKHIELIDKTEQDFADAVDAVEELLNSIITKKSQLKNSPQSEFDAIINSLNGGYTATSPGGDPITNPKTVPTGRNLVAISAEYVPTKEAWKVGKKLADAMLENFKKKNNGRYPKKVSFTLWSGSYIESEGTTIAEILYLLGVQPAWDMFGRAKTLRLIPDEELTHPRIDVLVQTSGQFRDLAASRLFLINKAVVMAAQAAKSEGNFISKGIEDAEKLLVEKGLSPKQARYLARQRVFGGVNGNYGTGIMDMVENSATWDSTKSVANTYISNMGAIYGGEDDWGNFNKGVFEAALLNTEAIVQPRQSNTWGALSLDHVYEFMGGLNLAVKHVTGNEAENYFNDFRNSSNPRIQGLKEAVWVESRTTILNPKYIKEYMKGGASSAEGFAETFRNAFGWNVMKPSLVEDRLWNDIYDVYIEDSEKLNVQKFFKDKNPYAFQEMTAVMLETVRKGYWKASEKQIKKMAKLHATLVKDYEAGCSGFVCDNAKLKSFIDSKISKQLQQSYNQQISKVREAPSKSKKDNVVLKKQEKEADKVKNNVGVRGFSVNTTLLIIGGFVVLLLIIVFIRKRKK